MMTIFPIRRELQENRISRKKIPKHLDFVQFPLHEDFFVCLFRWNEIYDLSVSVYGQCGALFQVSITLNHLSNNYFYLHLFSICNSIESQLPSVSLEPFTCKSSVYLESYHVPTIKGFPNPESCKAVCFRHTLRLLWSELCIAGSLHRSHILFAAAMLWHLLRIAFSQPKTFGTYLVPMPWIPLPSSVHISLLHITEFVWFWWQSGLT